MKAIANSTPTDDPYAAFSSPVDTAPAQSPATSPDPYASFSSPIETQPSAAPPQEQSSSLGALLRGIGQGATLNWLPTLSAMNAAGGGQNPGGARLMGENLLPSLFGSGGHQAFEKSLAESKAQEKADQTAHSGYSSLGEILGGIGSGLALPVSGSFEIGANGGRIANAVRELGNAASVGAGLGAVSGAGAAPDANSMGVNAAEGALTGAGLGAGGHFAGSLLTHLFGGAKANLGAMFSPEGRAFQMVSDRLNAAGANPQALAQKVEDMHAAGQDQYTLADAANEALGGLPGSIARQPGPGRAAAREFLADRQIGDALTTGARARNDAAISDLLGSDGSLAMEDSLTRRQKAASQPFYDEANQDPITMTPDLAGLVPRLQAAGAFQRAQKYMDLWGKPNDLGTLEPWDQMKKALDDKVSALLGAGQKNAARPLIDLKQKLVDELDAQSPNYAQARDVWSSDQGMKDALENGRQVFNPSYTREQLQSDLFDLTPGEQTMFRLGAANALREKLANAPGTGALPNAIKNGTAIRQKIEALAPNQPALDTFLTRMEGEQNMAATKQGAMGGSQTAKRLAEDTGTMGDIGELARSAYHAASPHPLSWLRAAAPYIKNVDPNMRGAVLNEARKIVLGPTVKGKIAPDPAAVAAFAKKMTAMGVKPDISGAIVRAFSRGLIPAQTREQDRPSPRASITAMTPEQMKALAPPAQSKTVTWQIARPKGGGPAIIINPATGESFPYPGQ